MGELMAGSYSNSEQIASAHATLVNTFKTGKTKSLKWRKWQLKQVWWMIEDNEERIVEAMREDLNRDAFETYLADIGGSKKDVLLCLEKVEDWAADEIPDAGIVFGKLCKSRIRQEPLGVALIIAAWNFPFILVFQPLISAITAGCCAVVKPSEVGVASQNLMAELIPKYLDTSAIRVLTGGALETTKMLEYRFDQIFYTGSPTVGRIIAAAAAKNVTPTVLELGGQAPAIVTATANVDVSAKRIAYSKYNNAGQICLSTNHVFVDPSIHDAFATRLAHHLTTFLSGAGKSQFVRIVNPTAYDRLSGLLKTTSGTITHGGATDASTRFIEPTIITDVSISDPLLDKEIFGPILPVIKADYKSAVAIVNSMPHPLGLYVFSTRQSEKDFILDNTHSGGVTINDIMLHAGVPNAPFSGVGDSGSGAYHGKNGFDAFTHRRTVCDVPPWMELLLGFRYPPYKAENIPKLTVTDAPFKRGETMEEQVVGGAGKWAWKVGRQLLRAVVKIALLAVLLALLDQYMGGWSWLLDVLGLQKWELVMEKDLLAGMRF